MPFDPLLRDLTVYDTEGTRWAVIQRWLKDINDTIAGGGGGGGGGERYFSNFILTGSGVVNNTFGYFKASSVVSWTRAQLFCQTGPVGADLIVTFIDAAGTSLGVTATVPAGSDYAETIFPSPVSLVAGEVIRCKVTQVGSTSPGGYITVSLVGSGARDFISMFFTGSGNLNQIFGYYKSAGQTLLTRAQISCQTPPTGSDLIVTFVDGSGVSLGVTATIPAGANYGETVFGSTLTIPNGGVVRAKITQIGSSTPGGYITVSLM